MDMTTDVEGDLIDPSALQLRGRIVIQNNAGFNSTNGVVAGNGTDGNPYIIENWTIDHMGYHGIFIISTNAHFIIRNCHIHNGTNPDVDGIYLEDVHNAQVRNNRLEDLRMGIFGNDIDDSIISDNLIRNTENMGIYILYASDTMIMNNVIMNASNGICIYGGYFIDVVNNTILGGTESLIDPQYYDGAISLEDSYMTIVSGNTVHDNNMTGISLSYYICESQVFDNVVYRNVDGIIISWASEIDINDNIIFENSGTGLLLTDEAWNSDVENNLIHNNTIGMRLNLASHMDVHGNTMWDNEFNFGMYESEWGLDLTPDNTVDGKPIIIYKYQEDKEVPSNAGFVGLFRCINITVKDLELSKNVQSLLIYDTHDSTIEGNIIERSKFGIETFSTERNVFIGNTIRSNEEGVHQYNTADTDITNNTFIDNDRGYVGQGYGGEVRIDGNTIANTTDYGVVIYYDRVRITNNTVFGSGRDGIYIRYSDDSVIEGNHVFDNNETGIMVDHTLKDIAINNDTVRLNSVHGNRIGIYIHKKYEGLTSDKVNNNTVYDNEIGIKFHYGMENTFDGNEVYDNSLFGVLFNMSYNCRVSNNSIHDNVNGSLLLNSSRLLVENNLFFDNIGYGINLELSGLHEIYNNYFANDVNYITNLTTENKWYHPKVQETNIVGGPFTAGNYWSDYDGEDTSGDLIGDTDIPFGPGDKFPLVAPGPDLEDLTSGMPRVGTNFTITAAASYMHGIQGVYVTYWFDSDGPLEVTLNRTQGDDIEGNYSLTLQVPLNASVLQYKISANSTLEVWTDTGLKQMGVIDDISPVLEDLSGTPTTGDNFTFVFNVSDNVGVADFMIEYNYDGSGWFTLWPEDGVATIMVPESAHSVGYTAKVFDESANSMSLEGAKIVVDNDAPVLEDKSEEPIMGTRFSIECKVYENRNIENVTVEYWLDGERYLETMSRKGDVYFHSMMLGLSTRRIEAYIRATDDSGNIGSYNVTWNVKDILDPTIIDHTGTPTTGDAFFISATVTDNIGINYSFLEYHFDHGLTTKIDFKGNHSVSVPSGARVLNYTIRCFDNAGNHASISNGLLVVDNDVPTIEDLSEAKAKAGKAFTVKIRISDNIGIGMAYIEYWYKGERQKLELVGVDGVFSGDLRTQEGAKEVHYIVYTADKAGNLATGTERTVTLEAEGGHGGSSWAIGAVVLLLIAVVLGTLLFLKGPWRKRDEGPEDDEMDDLETIEHDDEEMMVMEEDIEGGFEEIDDDLEEWEVIGPEDEEGP